MQVEPALHELQDDVVALVAVGEEEQPVGGVGAEAQLEPVLPRLHVLVLAADVVRDATVAVKRRALPVCGQRVKQG